MLDQLPSMACAAIPRRKLRYVGGLSLIPPELPLTTPRPDPEGTIRRATARED
jgi:hypothetical protein